MDFIKKSKSVLITLFIILLMVISARVIQIDANFEHDGHEYRVMFNQEDVLMNITQTMIRNDTLEYDIIIDEGNSSLTLVTEILHHTGRLWGVYIENSSLYYEYRAANDYKNLDFKLMDHVSNYTVKHVTKSPGNYVLALHNSHMHEEPDTQFNLLVLNGTIGEETIILADQMDHDHSETPATSIPLLVFVFSMFFIVITIKKRERKN
ncbi:MAG: hypothetical protein ACXAC2_23460 [Candidatus Kariarchaeaceae archaeon]|jgi:hypothetical protein